MTIMCEKVATSLEEGIKNIIETAKLDYAQWTDRSSKGEKRSEYFGSRASRLAPGFGDGPLHGSVGRSEMSRRPSGAAS